MKVLVVDDDPELLPIVAFALRQGGFIALEAATGEQALRVIAEEVPDLVILDVNLPGISGFDVCRRLRAGGDATPVLLLTVRSDEEDVVRGLDLGADDYLTKPFSPRTLLARSRALVRRAHRESAGKTEVGNLTLVEDLQSLQIAGRPPIRMTPLEFRLLKLLAAHTSRPVSTERILRHVWGARGSGDRQLLKQLIHRLRQKIEIDPQAPRHLVTHPGVGYRLEAGPASAKDGPPEGTTA